jgi:hypothetical protein
MKEILLLNKTQERKEHYIRVRVTFSFLFIDFHFLFVLGTIKLPFLFGTFGKVHVEGGRGTTMCATMVVAMQMEATSTMVLLSYPCRSRALCSKITFQNFFPSIWSNCIIYLSSLTQFASVESFECLQ